MSDLYDKLHDRVKELRDNGIEPDKIVVDHDYWEEIKEQAEVITDTDDIGDKTMLNGVRVLHTTSPIPDSRIVFEVGADE